MACFLVCTAEALVATVVTKVTEKKEKAQVTVLAQSDHAAVETKETGIPFSRKLKWLCYMLWGGSVLLAFEHIWHGEVVPWFPFLTAAADPSDAAEMLHEMATVGVCMAALVTMVWLGMVCVVTLMEKKARRAEADNSASAEG